MIEHNSVPKKLHGKFGFKKFPDREFMVDFEQSYLSPDEGLQIVVLIRDIVLRGDVDIGTWVVFCRANLNEVLDHCCEL